MFGITQQLFCSGSQCATLNALQCSNQTPHLAHISEGIDPACFTVYMQRPVTQLKALRAHHRQHPQCTGIARVNAVQLLAEQPLNLQKRQHTKHTNVGSRECQGPSCRKRARSP